MAVRRVLSILIRILSRVSTHISQMSMRSQAPSKKISPEENGAVDNDPAIEEDGGSKGSKTWKAAAPSPPAAAKEEKKGSNATFMDALVRKFKMRKRYLDTAAFMIAALSIAYFFYVYGGNSDGDDARSWAVRPYFVQMLLLISSSLLLVDVIALK